MKARTAFPEAEGGYSKAIDKGLGGVNSKMGWSSQLSAYSKQFIAFRFRRSGNDAVFHAQKYRHFVGFTTFPFFAPGEHLIGGRGINAVLSSKLLNRLSLMFQPNEWNRFAVEARERAAGLVAESFWHDRWR